jgi:hypothetical protein
MVKVASTRSMLSSTLVQINEVLCDNDVKSGLAACDARKSSRMMHHTSNVNGGPRK